jgi:lipoprotein-releasing system permease protein
MPYEMLVGWRYLFARRRHPLLALALAVSLAVTACGGVLFAATPARGTGILVIVFGSVAVMAALLLRFFSAFTSISILGVALGVRTLAVVLSVASGFQTEFEDKILGVNAHVLVMKYGLDFSEYEEVIGRVKKMAGVRGVAPFVLQEVMIARGSEQTGVFLKGVDPARVGTVLALPGQIEAGSIEALSDATPPPRLLLGRELGRRLRATNGDLVQLVSLEGNYVPGLSIGTEAPLSRDFRVAGSFFSGFDDYDRRFAFASLRDAQAFAGQGDVVTGVEIKLHEPARSGELVRTLETTFPDKPYRIIDWRELNHNLFAALYLQKRVLAIVLTLIVVVAAFNIVAALTLLVARKTREIAILKAQGMTAGGASRVFLTAGATIGLIGTAIGLAWAAGDCALVRRYGYPLDPTIYMIGQLPVRASLPEFALTAGVALAICAGATLYPARKAARLDPVAGLRL